jgi:hypothetical protein
MLVCCLIALFTPIYCSQAGIYYLQFFDRFIAGVGMSFSALIEVYLFTVLCKFDVTIEEVKRETGESIPGFIKAILTSPYLLGALACFLGLSLYQQVMLYVEYSVWLYIFGWVLSTYYIVIGLWFWWYYTDGVYHQSFGAVADEPVELS